MKKRKGSRGAISVFLAMILVPCIVVSSVFVDLSRVHLSKTMAESSADLALNSLLTNYDADLKEWYGMVASCQNIKEFYEVSAEYFLRTISSQGLSDEEIVLLSDYYSNATGDDTIYDLLKVECLSNESGMVSAVENANLANAALMKKQVVEFMKYRAPIEIASELVERFSADPTVTQAIEADANEPLVEDKKEFYNSEGELVEAAYYSYKAIRAYYIAADKDGLSSDDIAESYSSFQSYQDAYKEILRYVIANLTNTDNLKERYNRYTITKTYYNDLYSNPSRNFSEVYTDKQEVNGEEFYYIDLGDVEDLVADLQIKMEAFNTAKANFVTAAQPALNKLPYGEGANQTNPMQWWVLMNEAVNSSSKTNYSDELETAAQEMMRAYSRVLAIDSCLLRGVLPQGWTNLEEWKTKYGATKLISDVESLQSTYLTAGVTNNNDSYLKAVKNLESVSSANYGNLDSTNLYVTVDGERMNIDTALKHISSDLTSTRQDMQEYVDLLDTAINGDGGDTPSLEELKSYVKTYEQNLKNWTQTANTTYHEGQKTDMAQDDTEEIKTLKASVEIKEADVDVLKTRLKNIQSQLKAVISAIDSLKWGDTALKDISSVDIFKSKSGVSKGSIGYTNSEISSYTDTLYGQKMAPKTLPSMEHKNDSAYDPKIDPKTGEVDTPALWKYLYEKYIGTEKGMEEAKSEKDEANEKAENKAKEAKDKDRYNGGGENVPWAYSTGSGFNVVDMAGGAVGVIDDLISLDFSGMRDDIFATTYAMEMFSYATYENEGLYKLLKETDPDKITQLTLDNYSDEYSAVMGTSADEEKKWLSARPEDYYNKSLTNHLINKTNNPAYCAEVEYILCGSKGSTNSDNVKAVYSGIYAIRYGLNLVSSFQHFWNPVGSNTDPTATALFGAASGVQALTGGIVPIVVTEAVLLPILTVFETAKDLDRLECGFPVELYKTQPGQWWVSVTPQDPNEKTEPKAVGGISAFVSLISGEGLERHNTGNGLFYSDYLLLFTYLGFNSDEEAGMYQRMAEVIQFNLGTIMGDNGYSLKQSQLYFQLNANLRVKPLMTALPFFSMEEYDNEMDTKTDWCTYDIKTVRGYT